MTGNILITKHRHFQFTILPKFASQTPSVIRLPPRYYMLNLCQEDQLLSFFIVVRFNRYPQPIRHIITATNYFGLFHSRVVKRQVVAFSSGYFGLAAWGFALFVHDSDLALLSAVRAF